MRNGEFEYEVVDEAVTITGYTGSGGDVVIPGEIDGLPVIAIGKRALQDEQLTSVIIPDGVIVIGKKAFADNQLISVTIPDSVTVIEDGAFMNNQLTRVIIPASVDVAEDSFNGNLGKVYAQNGNRAGTHTSRDGGKTFIIADARNETKILQMFKNNAGKIPLTKDEKIKCNTIIHAAAVATGAMGIVPIGPADTLMITPAQIGMIISLGTVFNIRVSENLAKSILGGLAMAIAGRAVAATALSFIPVVGWLIKGGTAAGLTEAIGWVAVAHFHEIKEKHSKFAGKKEGYEEASAEYEAKLRRQAEEFIKMGTVHKSEMAEFAQLNDELTKTIIELSTGKDAESADVKERIRVLEGCIESLKKLDREK